MLSVGVRDPRYVLALLACLPCLPCVHGCTRAESIEPSPAAAVATISSAEAKAADGTRASSHAPARFVGRVVQTEQGGVRFAWSGTTVLTRFRGERISVRLHDDGKNVFQVVIDGAPTTVLKTRPGVEDYELARGLADGIHDVALTKRTEARVGEVVFQKFETDGTLLPASPPSGRRIEFIGDSITAGFGNEGPGPTCPFVPEQENEYASYAAIAARAVGAEHVTIAWSGKSIGEMTTYWQRALPARDDSRWDPRAWVPDVVVLNVGTNNFARFDPGEPKFLRVYLRLFERVRAAYPDAFIVCSLGPMLSDAYPVGRRNLTLAKRYMRATEKKLHDAGFAKFAFLEFPEQDHAHGLGCAFHPSRKTHRLMADRLVALLRGQLSW